MGLCLYISATFDSTNINKNIINVTDEMIKLNPWVVTKAQWLTLRLSTRELPGSNPVKRENYQFGIKRNYQFEF